MTVPDIFIVENRAGLLAAIKSMAQSSYDAARLHPFEVRLVNTGFRLMFREGVTVRRLPALIKQVSRTPSSAFVPR